MPITLAAAWVAELRGITLPDVTVRVRESRSADRIAPARRRSAPVHHTGGPACSPSGAGRSCLPTGVSPGPWCSTSAARSAAHARPQTLELECDFLPAVSAAELDELLRAACAGASKRLAAAVLPDVLPRRLADQLLAAAGIANERKAAELTRAERAQLAAACKSLRLPIAGTLGFGKAEVTAGGVALDEVDSRTMQSKLAPGMFLAGEVLDLDGPIGGYNFQAAWSTGWLAGSSV